MGEGEYKIATGMILRAERRKSFFRLMFSGGYVVSVFWLRRWVDNAVGYVRSDWLPRLRAVSNAHLNSHFIIYH